MSYWTDDRNLDVEQRRLDAQQEDAAKRIIIAGGPHHRTLLALEAVASSVEPLLGDGKYHRNPSTANLAEGETNDAFFESIAGVDYADVERRFAENPKMYMQEVVTPEELERRYNPVPLEGNRKERRAQAARARDKRWRIKL